MKITRDNYEQYFLDHAEGTLSQEMEKELALFLELNPDLKPVLEDFDASPLPPVEIKNDRLKDRLKKNIRPTLHIDEAHVDEWLIRETEGLLSETESAELKEFIGLNPAFSYDQKLYHLTKIKPDSDITFPRKNQLKKKVPVVLFTRMAWAISAAAAVILLFIGIRFFNVPENNTAPQEIHSGITMIPQVNKEIKQSVAGLPDEPGEEHVLKGTPAQKDSSPEGLQPEGTPALTLPPSQRPESFRMQPSEAVAINLSNPVESPEPVLYAYAPTPVELSEEKKESSTISKVFGNMVVKTRDAVRSKSNFNKIRETDINFWTIAEAGVKGFNTISDRDLELLVRRDDQGNIKSYALVEEDRLLFTRNPGNN
jgi:hypothetical protein